MYKMKSNLNAIILSIFVFAAGCAPSEQYGVQSTTNFTVQPSRVDFGDFTYNSMEGGPRLAFFPKSRNQPSSYELVYEDPFLNGGKIAIHQFTVVSGVCGNDQDRGDCGDDPSGRSLKSVRSELSENNHNGTRFGRIQPTEASYEWEVGFPTNFPVGPRQTSGYYIFGQWHNGSCPHMNIGNWVNNDDYQLHLRINEIIPGHRFGDCQPAVSLPVIDVRSIEGGWAAFRVDVRWSTGDDGYAKVYVNDNLRVNYEGRTLVPQYVGRNHFDFGIYLANSRDLETVRHGTLYYRNVRRANR